MRTVSNILRHELIGLECSILSSPNAADVGICGFIVDETRNTIRIETSKGIKTFEKQYKLLRVTLPDGTKVKIDGNALSNSPVRRVNMRVKGGRN
ncbi:MAG TPA: ribonuclease P protein component 1 [Methanocorpusculum sp.]|nr:ribonuclease P protein component 1 [Methanocorpusculum sp.]